MTQKTVANNYCHTNLATKHQKQIKHNRKKAWSAIKYILILNVEKIHSVYLNKTARDLQTLPIAGQTATPTNRFGKFAPLPTRTVNFLKQKKLTNQKAAKYRE